MATRAEVVCDLRMHGQETLRVAYRLESSHSAFAFPRRLMGVVGAVVEPAAFPVLYSRHHFAPGGHIALQLIGDDCTWHILQPFSSFRKNMPGILEDASNALTPLSRSVFAALYDRLVELEERLARYDQRIQQIFMASPICRKIEQVRGVGPLIATAVVAGAGDGKEFRRGRQFAAWLGLVMIAEVAKMIKREASTYDIIRHIELMPSRTRASHAPLGSSSSIQVRNFSAQFAIAE